MRKWMIVLAGILIVNAVAAQEPYAVSAIPATLLKNANVVKRMEEINYVVISFTKTKLYRKYAITILNENGEDFAFLVAHYDKLRTIKFIEGKLFDSNGKELKSLKKKDIEDRSNVSGISLMEDNRVKIHNFYFKSYPYTVEYEMEIEFNNTLMFNPWFPQPTEKYAIEKSTMEVVCPSWYTFQYRAFNYPGEPLKTEEKGNTIYTWKVANIPAVMNEYASPNWQNLTTCIYFKPDKFEFEGYKGSMTSWNELGNFQVQLNQGRDKLPDDIKEQVHKLTDNVQDPREKVRILYEYMQKNTRYISIQLGIGGLQPFEASFVAKNAYGDCKALSNYMYALLKEIGIKSCYSQIKAGAGEFFFMPDFVSDQFDHIILCVPMKTDSIWLECTSQTEAAGYLGSFTSNRYALLIDENGGHLVRTPKYNLDNNLQVRHIEATIDEEGFLGAVVKTSYRAEQQDRLHSIINGLSKDKLMEFLKEDIELATYDVKSFDYKEQKSKLPEINETLDLVASNYATVSGKRFFVIPNIFTRTHRKLKPAEKRTYDLVLDFEFKDVDTATIKIPAGYTPESMPADIKIESPFGKYTASVKLAGNTISYFRSYEHYSGRFPPTAYNELVKFYESVYKADRSKVVLVKSETAPALKGF